MNLIRNKGVALVSVLVISLLITSLITAITISVKLHINATQIIKDYSENESELMDLQNKLVYLLVDTQPHQVTAQEKELFGFKSESWQIDGQWSQLDENTKVRFFDEASKVAVVPFNHGHFRILLKGLGVNNNQENQIIDCILDWIDPDDLKRLNGGENFYYKGLGKPNFPRNAPLESIEELKNICGMEKDIYEQLDSELTVYGDNYINLMSASDVFLKGMFGEDIAAQLTQLRREKRLNKSTFVQITSFAETEYIRLSFSPIIRIELSHLTGQTELSKVFVLNRKKTNLSPYQLYQLEN